MASSINDFAGFTTSVGAGYPYSPPHLDTVNPPGQIIHPPVALVGQPVRSTLDFIVAVESEAEMSHDEYVAGMQRLIDSGTVWSLQGAWQRAALSCIAEGECHE